ncbi:MAG: AbgT family transporter [Roseburia sp.]
MPVIHLLYPRCNLCKHFHVIGSAKWAIFAPIFVPMFMLTRLSSGLYTVALQTW